MAARLKRCSVAGWEMSMHPGAPSRRHRRTGPGTLLSMTTAEDEADVRTAAIADLTRINLDDLVLSFGWQDHPVLAGMARRLLRNSAQKFAHQITEFDTAVGRDGFVSA